MRGRNRWLLALLATLLAAGTAGAQVAVSEQRSISVNGTGEASGTPDIATINVGVNTLAPTAIEASKQNEALISRVMAALTKSGIADRDMQTADYSIWPEQSHDPKGTGEVTITGYRVNNTVRVVVRDLDKLGGVLGAVTNAGVNTINGISFGIEDTGALEARAREAAMADARAKAEALAKLAGVELGDVLTLSMSSGGGYPRPMARMSMAHDEVSPSISTGELSIGVNVQLTYAIR